MQGRKPESARASRVVQSDRGLSVKKKKKKKEPSTVFGKTGLGRGKEAGGFKKIITLAWGSYFVMIRKLIRD